MTPFQPVRVHSANMIVTSFAALTVVLAACGGAATASPIAAPAAAQSTLTATVPPTPRPTSSLAATSAPTAAATAALVLPAAASQPQTIHLILHATNDTFGTLTGCSSPGSCQGDFMVGYDPLFDAATGKEVGTLAYECFLVDPASTLYHCPGNTFTLTGRGQIVFAEVILHEVGGPPTIAPITGGTGQFLGATGTVTSKKLSAGGDFVITITG
jgi:hypothetical protein